MSDEAIVTVSVGVPLQLFWSTLGWLAVSGCIVFLFSSGMNNLYEKRICCNV